MALSSSDVRCVDKSSDNQKPSSDKSASPSLFPIFLYMSSGTLEINADAIVSRNSGVVKRTIPILHRYSSVGIGVASGTGVRITTDAVNTEASIGETGFVYDSIGRLQNNTSDTLVCLVAYNIIWNNVSSGVRLSWIQVGESPTRYAMRGQASTSFQPCQGGSAIVRVPPGSYITVWVYQNTGLGLTCVAQDGMPWISITLI